LEQLVRDFRGDLRSGELRSNVLALIPAFEKLQDLGASLIPAEEADSAIDRLRAYFLAYPRVPIEGQELFVISGIQQWARRVRELREEGWPIATSKSGDYLLEADRQSLAHDRKIDDETRGAVLRRDRYECRRCKWNHDMFNRSDPRYLELHHVLEHAKGGSNTPDNLVTLCTVCHATVLRRRQGGDSFLKGGE
jgi:5-methylcytosine-specific restriction endonuclease McrA